MFKPKTAKEIKDATKILTYLGRAEKYFDLELVKNGRPVKPLLMIADIIDPLRQISEVAAHVEGNKPLPQYAAEAFQHSEQISSVCADILAINPRGLASGDKGILSRLAANIEAIKRKAALDKIIEPPLTSRKAEAPAQNLPEHIIEANENIRIVEQYQFPRSEVQDHISYNYELPQNAPAFNANLPEEEHFEPTYNIAQAEAKIYHIHPENKDNGFDTEGYLATTYPGMNLQEAADIIEQLAQNPKNHNLVLLEHSSQIKPISMGVDIIDDLRRLAPIADAIENSSEILDKEPIKILSRADQIITICADIAALTIEGLDLRKRKLLSKFIKADLTKLSMVARNAYPEAFSLTTDSFGELVTATLVDFAELLTAKAAYHEDRLYAELLALISYQIAEYANYNELRTKFDVIIKKNRIHSNPKVFDNKIKMAWLRAVTYVPQIARHSQEIASLPQTSEAERRLIEKSLEILQLAYIDARDKYAAYLQDISLIKAA